MMPSDTHKVVIHVDRTPAEEHVRGINASSIVEVVINKFGDQFQQGDIVLHRRNGQMIKTASYKS